MSPLTFEFYSIFLVGFIAVFLLSVFASYLIQRYATRSNIIDIADFDPLKKVHTGKVPLLVGSGAILVAILVMILPATLETFDIRTFGNFTNYPQWDTRLWYFFGAIITLLVGGYCDDKYRISPRYQLGFVSVAVLLVVYSGVTISVSRIVGFDSPLLDALVTAVWLFLCAASTKFLDGHDGLVTTLGIVGFGGIASIALFDRIQEPLFAVFALTWMFALMGFLPFNFPKARAYLGDGASIAIGFAIGYFSLILNSKLIVSSAVLGLFLLDLILVWLLRIKAGRNFLTSGDRLHWHHRLLDAGFDKLQVLVLTTIIILANVHIAVFLASSEQYNLSVIQIVGFVVTLVCVSLLLKKRTKQARKK